MSKELLNELLQEAQITKRLLDRIPEDRLEWTPHPKSMTLGQLALHIARIPGDLSQMAQLEAFDAANANFTPPQPESKSAILAAYEECVAAGSAYLEALTAGQGDAPWTLSFHGNAVMSIPRVAMLRSFLFNHLYHHRGQLSLYLRLLDVPVPVIYGRSADENPFA